MSDFKFFAQNNSDNVNVSNIVGSSPLVVGLTSDVSPVVSNPDTIDLSSLISNIQAAISIHNSEERAHETIISALNAEIDSKLMLKADISDLITKNSQLENDSNFATVSQLPEVPTSVSAFLNDSNYVTTVQFQGELAQKANTSLNNISSNIDYVIESYISADGNNWWRKYRSGWLEQGGWFDTNATVGVITMPKAFSGTQYHLLLTTTYTTTTQKGYAVNKNTKTSQSFTYYVDDPIVNLYWEAKGF